MNATVRRSKCPCIYSEEAPICRADMEAMRVPAADHLARFCLTPEHRRCVLFRLLLGTMAVKPRRSGSGNNGKSSES